MSFLSAFFRPQERLRLALNHLHGAIRHLQG
jgi:hypothetical protein